MHLLRCTLLDSLPCCIQQALPVAHPLHHPVLHRLQERGIRCACERCSEPLHTSTDRYLEGVWCLHCTIDVLVVVSTARAALVCISVHPPH